MAAMDIHRVRVGQLALRGGQQYGVKVTDPLEDADRAALVLTDVHAYHQYMHGTAGATNLSQTDGP
eukprot:5904904-Pyramimonas_sp.AAC.1